MQYQLVESSSLESKAVRNFTAYGFFDRAITGVVKDTWAGASQRYSAAEAMDANAVENNICVPYSLLLAMGLPQSHLAN